jgi:hypothetical protein
MDLLYPDSTLYGCNIIAWHFSARYGALAPFGWRVGIDHPALQLTVLRKPYEMLLRSYCPTSGARSLAREAAARRFLTVRLYAGRFSLVLSFAGTKERT